jgi:hypothetical protein
LVAEKEQQSKWHAALNSLHLLRSKIYDVVSERAVLTDSSKTALGDAANASTAPAKSSGSTVERLLVDPVIEATIGEFFTNARVAELDAGVADGVFDNAMNTWWERARTFKLPSAGKSTFAQLLHDSLAGEKQNEVAEVAPVFASLMFELMVLLSEANDSLFLYSEADLLKKVRWPAIGLVAPSRVQPKREREQSAAPPAAEDSHSHSEHGVAEGDNSSDATDDDHVDRAADLAAVAVPPWLVHQRDGRDLNTHRKVDLAVFSHRGTRDTNRFNVCAQRSVCTAIEVKRDVSDKSLRKAVSQLTQDYATTVGTQYVGERRVMFGIVGTAAQLRFCQLWSDTQFHVRVSPFVSIASAAEVASLIADPSKRWCDVVAGRSAFLQQIARVVVHSAAGPTIDCGLKVPQGVYSTAVGEVVFDGVLGCTRRSIVLSASITTQPDGETRRVAFKRYTNASAAARAHEREALRKFGGLPGVVSLVASGGIANDGSDIEWIATEPVGKALSQICLCSSAARRAVVRALGDGPVAALSALHEQGHLFADIHDGNIILSMPADDDSEGDEEDGEPEDEDDGEASSSFAKFVDLETVYEIAKGPHSSPTVSSARTADDNEKLTALIRSIEHRS